MQAVFAKSGRSVWALWGLLSIVGCGPDASVPLPPEVDLTESYEEVQQFLAEKKSAITESPTSAKAWGEYAMALDAHEFNSEAIECYRRAQSIDSAKLRWKYLLAVNLQADTPQEAQKLLREIVPQKRATVSMLLRFVDLQRELGETEGIPEALKAAESMVTASGEVHPAVTVRLAQVAVDEKRYDKAEELLKAIPVNFDEVQQLRVRLSALKNEPTSDLKEETMGSVDQTLVDNDLAAIMRFRRDPLWRGKVAADDARAGNRMGFMTLQQLVRKHPELIENRVQLAMLIHGASQTTHAVKIVEEGLESAPEDLRLLSAHATLTLLEEDWEASEESLRTIVRLAPDRKSGWADLGFVLEQQSETEAAIEAYDQALKLDPDYQEIRERRDKLVELQ